MAYLRDGHKGAENRKEAESCPSTSCNSKPSFHCVPIPFIMDPKVNIPYNVTFKFYKPELCMVYRNLKKQQQNPEL